MKRKLNLLEHRVNLPFWTEPDYSGCVKARRNGREDRKRIDPCPYDTSYATEWVETPVNVTATAPCPSTMGVNRTDVVATRRCVAQWVGSGQVGVWLDPYLVDCVVATMDSKIPPQEETVASNLNVWVADNTCEEDVTNSTAGSFQWNTTIVGGIDSGTCPFGSLIPPPEVVEFIKFSIGIATAFMELWKNVTIPANNTGEWDALPRNDTEPGLTNETLKIIKEELINRTIELIENVTFGAREVDGDGDSDGDSNSDKFSRDTGKANKDSKNTREITKGGEENTPPINVANWWVDIGKAVDRIDQHKFGSGGKAGVAGILEIMQMVDSLPGSVLNKPMLPAIMIEKGKILLDLRGIDPVVKAVDDLIRMEQGKQSGGRVRRDVEDDVMEISRNDGIIGGQPEDDEIIIEEEMLLNFTAISEAFENAVKFPTRKCEENRVRAGVLWKHADTWMCRTENASYIQDMVRLLDDTGYLDEVKEALDESGLGDKVDGTLFRVVFKMWEAFDVWRQTRQKSKLTINAIQAISYLLSLDVAVLPPWLSQQIVQMIEDMANEPLPEDVTSVDIVTENVVVNIAEVEKEEFIGITFASIGPSGGSPGLSVSGTICDVSECSLGDNMFMRIEGDLNNSLNILDVEAVDEYFYMPQTIFNISAHIMQNYTYCKYKDDINDTIEISNEEDMTPLLQFVIYENDQLFRTKAGEVPVVLPDSCQLNGSRSWRVATRVISGTVGGYCMAGLQQPILYSMKHRFDVSDSEHRLCVYWDYNERGGLGAWSTDGCQVSMSDSKHTTCECDHLTNFAVIVDIWNQLGKGGLPVTHDWVLGIISVVGCSLSLIGLAVTILCLIFVKHLRESKTTPTRLMLCLTLFISMTFLLVGMERTEDPDACAVFAFFIHYFTLTSLMWMGIEAVYLYRNIVAVVINPNKNFFHYCCGIAWGVPAVIVALTAAMNWDAYGNEHSCWISGVGVFFGAFLAPVLVIVTLNFVVFGMVLFVLSNRPTDRIGSKGGASVHKEPVRKWKEFMGIVSITVLLGLTWVFGAFSVGNEARFFFLYLFTIFNSSQGFFIFIFYCLLSLIGGKKKHRSSQRSSDRVAATPSGMSNTFSSAKKVPHVRVGGDDEGKDEEKMKRKKLMADWMASCQDLHLDEHLPEDVKGNFNQAFCFMDEGGLHNISSSAGDLAFDSGGHNTTMLGIVMSARFVRMQSQSSDAIKTSQEKSTKTDTPNGDEDSMDTPEFVVSTGIIFGGKARRSSVASLE
ncbi:uncharacterized protein [Amphiura filiformis]|uniref:uncharacterized protein n=1 Tax=Amphiura filiformis TaxID=82378 RepID=UPI003B212C63